MENPLHASMFHAFPAALLLLDSDGLILEANQAAGALPSGAGGDMAGRDFFLVFARLDNLAAIRDRFLSSRRDAHFQAVFDTTLKEAEGGGLVPIHLRFHRFDAGKSEVCTLAVMEVPEHRNDLRNLSMLLRNGVQRMSDIRHDINNPLMGIFGHAELLSTDRDASENVRKSAGIILEQARKIRDLIIELGQVRDSFKE